MKAIIMAGGEGSRLRPLTCDLPKPMVPLVNRPVMHYSIELLKKYGIRDIGATLQYLPDEIISYFQDGSEYGVNLKYFIEDKPLGTAGSVKNACEFLDEPFIVVSGDALTDINLKKAIDFHIQHKSKATLVLKSVRVPLEYGVVVTDDEGKIKRFLEKPNWGEVFSDTVNTGIYILEPEVLDYLEKDKKYDFSQDLFPRLLKENQPLYGYITDEYWCDIGNAQTYSSSHWDMLDGKVSLPIFGRRIMEGVWVGEGVEIDSSAHIEGPCCIGDYTRIRANACIGPYSVIGAYCDIDSDASIKRSILWDHARIGRYSEIRGAVICNKAELKEKTSLYEGAVVGEGCMLEDRASIRPGVKVWPEKTIEQGTVVQSNVIWGTRASKNLFGKDGIHGSINMDLNPQSIARMGAAFGAFLKPGKRVAVSADSSPGNNMLKYGLISGMLSTGLDVYDLGQLTTPMLRYAVRYLGLDGGVQIFAYPDNIAEGHLHFLDAKGCNLAPSAERKIENLYIRDDFQRQPPADIKRMHTLSDIPVFYIRNLVDGLDVDAIKKRSPRISITAKGRLSGYVLDAALREAGCTVVRQLDSINGKSDEKYDLSCVLEANGEDFTLYDEQGGLIGKELRNALIGMVYMKEQRGRKLVVPSTASSIMERLADELGCSVVRSKSSRQAVMEEAFKLDRENGSKTQLFSLYFDGIAAIAKITELISRENTCLSSLVKSIPKIHMQEREINCPWNAKGRVMRMLIEEETRAGRNIELFEGIRINHKNGWALVLPDSDDPVCRVYSEGFTEEYAEELAGFYGRRIAEISRSNTDEKA